MKAYAVDLRHRVLAAVDRGMPRSEVAATFGGSVATIKRLVALRRTQPDLVPHRSSGRRRTIPVEQHGAWWAQVAADPDATIAMHTDRWQAAYKTTRSQWTVGRAIRRFGWTRTKRRWVPPSVTRSNALRTASALLRARQPTSYLWMRVAATATLTPTYARAPRGARAYGTAPRNTAANTTLRASMRTAGMGAAFVLPGATATAAGVAYVERVLGPRLRPGQSVVLDTLAAHTDMRVRAAIAARDCDVWDVPPYAPDVSPMEEAFANRKTLLRRAAARTRAAVRAAARVRLGSDYGN